MGITPSDYLSMQRRLMAKAPSGPVEYRGEGDRINKKESDIQDEITAWLKTQSHQCWWDVKRMDRETSSRVGIPDYVVFYRGVCCGIECKRPGAKPTVEQLGELAWMRKAGARTLIAYSVDDVIAFFKQIDTELNHETTSHLTTENPPTSPEAHS